MTGVVQNKKATNKGQKHLEKEKGKGKENELWPEEEQALEDINTGKTTMKKQTGKKFLEDLEAMVNG